MKKTLLLAAFGLLASPALAQSNQAATSAVGNNNNETITQSGSTNEAKSGIVGDDNVTSIIQTGAGNQAQPNGGFGIKVDGDGNNLSIDQEGNGNDAGISAVGQNNNNVPQQSDDNVATIEQVGDNHLADFVIRGSGNGAVGAAGLMQSVQMGGNNNKMQVGVDGDLNGVELMQDGTNNLATVDIDAINGQTLSTNNLVTIDQVGDNNKVGQGLFGAPRGVEITGNDNTVDVDQVGTSNMALVAQEGDLNTATIEQYGVGSNEAYVLMSDGAFVDVLQDGQDNVLQGLTAGSDALVLNGASLTVDQVGIGNTAFVSSDASTATINQMGNGNTSTVSQQ